EGPLTVSEENGPPQLVANWAFAEAKLHGTPGSPDFASMSADRISIDRTGEGSNVAGERLLRADRIEMIARLADGSAAAHRVIDLLLRLGAAAAPAVHPLVAEPTDAEIAGRVRGLPALTPRSATAWLEQLRTRGTNIEIGKARVQQGEAIAVS